MANEHAVTVTSTADRGYHVETAAGTAHDVTIPVALIERLSIDDLDEAQLVRESFAFLLEREPATSILREFSVDVISRYFPEYEDEIRTRLT
jgi:hypothetical protein